MLVSLGHDTELFGARDGKIIPLSPDILSGTKEDPFKIGKHASLQLDNVLCEVTSPPAHSAGVFAETMKRAKALTEKWLMVNHKIEAVYDSHHKFNLNDVMTPWAMQNGCAPDFSADLDDPVAKIDMSLFTTLKTASGHIHIGVHKPEEWNMTRKIQIVRALDFALGAPLAILHNDPKRRQLYGRAARFRNKPYGFEYRTPDNYWFGHGDPFLYHAIFEVIKSTVQIDPNSRNWGELNEHHSMMCDAINKGEMDKVADFMAFNPFYQLDYEGGKRAKRRFKSKYNIPPIDFNAFTMANDAVNQNAEINPHAMANAGSTPHEQWLDDEMVDEAHDEDENY